MQKILFLSALAILAISGTQAQIKPDFDKSKVKKTAPGTPAPPPPVNKTTVTSIVNAPVYSLTAVRVKIRTGNDNKEFPSKVLVTLKTKNASSGDWSAFYQLNLDNEMKINSDTEFGMEAQSKGESKLDAFQSSGVKLILTYLPNFFADAWKIENISLVLEFKDQFGNLHPTLGSKTIVFSNAYGFLNNDYRLMECVTDGSFAPLTAVIKKP